MPTIRQFLSYLLSILALTFAVNASVVAQGKEYTVLSPSLPVETGKKIEVLEIFSYACPHCADLNPLMEAWVKKLPKDVAFRRLPATFREAWIPLAKTYYAAEILALPEKFHEDVFKAIHVESRNLSDEKQLFEWVASKGVDRKKFMDAYNSFTVQNKIARTPQLVRGYGIKGVPAIVIDGKYVTASSEAGGHEGALAVADTLIKRARQERGTLEPASPQASKSGGLAKDSKRN